MKIEATTKAGRAGALDAVMLMATSWEFQREHMPYREIGHLSVRHVMTRARIPQTAATPTSPR